MDFSKQFRIYTPSCIKKIKDYKLEEVTLEINYINERSAMIRINSIEELCKLVNTVGKIVLDPNDEVYGQTIIIYDYYLE